MNFEGGEEETILCCLRGRKSPPCTVVCSCKGVPMEEIPLVYSVNTVEFDWLFSTVVTGGVIPLLWEDLSCPYSMLFKVCVLLDDLR